MPHLLTVPSALSVALVLAPAAPVPKEKPGGPVYYYPTTPGAKAVYRLGGKEVVMAVTWVTREGGTAAVSAEFPAMTESALSGCGEATQAPKSDFRVA